ncbi:13633_t:CDS:2 [Entrophospora sp. SA101]|nr:13633_t:CDS:2 [Entrophospora sp. SA101]
MSYTPIPSIKVVKKWKQANVVDFLKEKKEELELENEDIQIIDNNMVSDCAFLELSQEDLERWKMPGGPAKTITILIENIKGETRGHEQECKIEDSLYFSILNMLKTKPEFIPSCLDLLNYLQQPFAKPIKVNSTLYDFYLRSKIPQETLNQFFVSSDKASSRLWTEYIVHIACPPETSATEDSFHGFWDALIVKPFKIGCPDGLHNQNTSCHTSTRKYRPNLLYLVFDACLARREEKGPETNDDPAMELILKLTWTYGNCPYIFGYYAIATRVMYCYLYLEGNSIEWKDLLTCLLDKVEGRIQAFNIGRNIGRLLYLLCQTVPEYFQQEFVVLHRTSGKVIEFMQNTVVKHYPSVDSVMNLKTLYDEMAKHQEALCCVLTALKSIDRDSWFIIDFDDACHAPSNIPNTQLAKESHAPEIFEFHHNENVDIWSVGYLIQTASVELQGLDELKFMQE